LPNVNPSMPITREEIDSEVQKAFGHLPRPRQFIRGTCSCCECLEHEAEMQSFARDDLPLDQVNNPGWDPICFASNEAFLYLMPGLAGLVLDHTDDYVDQFLFHIEQPERLAAFTPVHARTLLHVLDFLLLHQAEALERSLVADEIRRIREQLEGLTSAGDLVRREPRG
jgi:hypothetical protein